MWWARFFHHHLLVNVALSSELISALIFKEFVSKSTIALKSLFSDLGAKELVIQKLTGSVALKWRKRRRFFFSDRLKQTDEL